MVIETEFMNKRVVPRGRFVYPAKAAIFIMGTAPGELQEPAPTEDRQAEQRAPTDESSIGQRPEAQEHPRRQEKLGDSLWFSGPPLMEEEMQYDATSHPRNEDIREQLTRSETTTQPNDIICALCRRPGSAQAECSDCGNRVCTRCISTCNICEQDQCE